MRHGIIAIGREFGSGGHKIGQMISDRLQIAYYDNELITLAGERGGLSEKKLEKFDERRTNPYFYEINYSGNERVEKGKPVPDTLYQLQKEVILDIAQKQDAVIVGRCADYILKKAGIPTLSVFIAAPLEQRVKRTMALQNLDEKTVLSMTKKKDKSRKKYYESHTGQVWGDPSGYDLYFDMADKCEGKDMSEVADAIIREYLK